MPIRIQRRRTKGWRMPDGAVYLGRPTKWGNPFETAEQYWQVALDRMAAGGDFAELHGKDLVCWCPLDAECHADVLFELAYREAASAEGNRASGAARGAGPSNGLS